MFDLRQEEILDYLKSFARHFDLYKHIKFNQNVKLVQWNARTQMWKINTQQGHEYDANFVISAPGPLHKPSMPKFKGNLNIINYATIQRQAFYRKELIFNMNLRSRFF